MMIALGVDPGLANTGWALVEKRKRKYDLLDSGCIQTSSKESTGARLNQIHDAIESEALRGGVDAVGVERVFFGKNTTSAISTAKVVAVIEMLSSRFDLCCVEINPVAVKRAVGASGCDKSIIVSRVNSIFQTELTNDHEADAVAVAVATHLSFKHVL